MPAWLLHTVAGGLLTGLLLAMVIGFCLVDTNGGKGCAHKKQQTQSSPGVCCLCGNARNRKEEAMKSRTEVGYFQSLVDAACVTFFSSFRSGTFQRPGSFQGSWPNLRSLLRKVGRRNTPVSNGGEGIFPAESVACTENTSPVPSPTDGSDADSRTTITTTITTTTSSSSASAASSCGVTSSSNEKEDTKQLSQRRLVLEILMSTSGGEMPRATRVRLKMETNSSTDQVAGSSPGEDRTLRERDASTKGTLEVL